MSAIVLSCDLEQSGYSSDLCAKHVGDLLDWRTSLGNVFLEETQIMTIKLHYHPLSTYSRRVLIGFAEKQIPHELVVVDMAARRHREQLYLMLNPYGRVPTLEEDGFVLFS